MSAILKELNPITIEEIECIIEQELTDKQFELFRSIIGQIKGISQTQNNHTNQFKNYILTKILWEYQIYGASNYNVDLNTLNINNISVNCDIYKMASSNIINSYSNHLVDKNTFLQDLKKLTKKSLILKLECGFHYKYKRFDNHQEVYIHNIAPPNCGAHLSLLSNNSISLYLNTDNTPETQKQLKDRIRLYTEIFYRIHKMDYKYTTYAEPIYKTDLTEYFNDFLFTTNNQDKNKNKLIDIFNNIAKVNYAKYTKNHIIGNIITNQESALKYQIVEYFEKISQICNKLITQDDIEYLFHQQPYVDEYQKCAFDDENFNVIPYYISQEKSNFIEVLLIPYIHNSNYVIEDLIIFIETFLPHYYKCDIKHIYNKISQIMITKLNETNEIGELIEFDNHTLINTEFTNNINNTDDIEETHINTNKKNPVRLTIFNKDILFGKHLTRDGEINYSVMFYNNLDFNVKMEYSQRQTKLLSYTRNFYYKSNWLGIISNPEHIQLLNELITDLSKQYNIVPVNETQTNERSRDEISDIQVWQS